MMDADLPRLDRNLSRLQVCFFSVLMYCVISPINWVMTRLGTPLVLRPNKRARRVQEEVKKAFDGYTPTSHDIFVCTYAKSGTNWMMQIAYQTAFKGEGEFENIHDVIPWPDFHIQEVGKMIIPLDEPRILAASPVKRRVIKTHLAAQYVPYNDQARYLTVIRDPKDAFVSSYHFQHGIFGPIMPSVDAWFESFFQESFPVGFGSTWAQHAASWWALHDKPNVLVLSFGDMKKDLTGTVDKVVDFLDIPLTDSQREAVIMKSSFDYMKNLDDRFFPLNMSALPWANVSLVRSGKDGGSGELLSLEQQRRIDETFQAELQALGSDFPYADFCRIA